MIVNDNFVKFLIDDIFLLFFLFMININYVKIIIKEFVLS